MRLSCSSSQAACHPSRSGDAAALRSDGKSFSNSAGSAESRVGSNAPNDVANRHDENDCGA
eukprot:5528100-Prymnesium_polylepis.1